MERIDKYYIRKNGAPNLSKNSTGDSKDTLRIKEKLIAIAVKNFDSDIFQYNFASKKIIPV